MTLMYINVINVMYTYIMYTYIMLCTIKPTYLMTVSCLRGAAPIGLLVMKTLSVTPRPLHHWKAENLSFLYVLLVWGVKLVGL
jgi:hypothetical protein